MALYRLIVLTLTHTPQLLTHESLAACCVDCVEEVPGGVV